MIESAHETYDVAILGAGFEGGLLGTILARQGAKVLLIESGTHPRFAVGESTVRHVFRMLKIIGERYDVPEIIEKFSSADSIHKHVTTMCGEKRNFGFVYHREGRDQNASECTQLVIPPFREGYEAHLYRQDIDSFLTYTAINHGATVHYRTSIADIDIQDDGCTLTSSHGDVFKSRYIVDGSGYRSLLAMKFKLREEPSRCNTFSRSLFTHMLNVTPYDATVTPRGAHGMPQPWYSGTCHHIFDGGWLWVIPFNNREGSTNPLVSVGLQLDPRRWPKPRDITPEQEFHQFLERFPSMAAQFEKARAVRDWVSTERIQFSSKRTVGERYCLMAHASGFIDPLFSRGLPNACELINALAVRLLRAFQDDDFSPERFDYIERMQQINLDYNDRLVNCAYISFKSFELWNAFFRVWVLGVGLGDLRLTSAHRRFTATHDESVLPDAEEPMGLFFAHHAGYKKLFEDACDKVEAFEAGTVSAHDAARHIFELMARADYAAPANHLADPAKRYVDQGEAVTVLKTVAWLLTSAPPDIKKMGGGILSDLNPRRLMSRKVAPEPSAI